MTITQDDIVETIVRQVCRAVAEGRRLPIGPLVEAMATRYGFVPKALTDRVHDALRAAAEHDFAHALALEVEATCRRRP